MALPSLHKSTKVVAALLAVMMVLTQVPGRVVCGDASLASGNVVGQFSHGWPGEWLRRGAPHTLFPRLDIRTDLPNWGIPWLTVANWRFGNGDVNSSLQIRRFRPWIALGDALVAALAIVVGAADWELRCRRTRLLSFALSDMFMAVTLLSLTFGRLMHHARESRHERQIVNNIDGVFHSRDWRIDHAECVAPRWLQSLVGYWILPEFTWRVTGVEICALNLDKKDAARLREVPYLRYIYLWEQIDNFSLLDIQAISQLRTLDCSGSCIYLDDEQFADLLAFKQLETLIVDRRDMPTEMFRRLKAELPIARFLTSQKLSNRPH